MHTDAVLSFEFAPNLSTEIATQLTTRERVRITTSLTCKDEVAGKLLVTVVSNASPTPFEKKWVWGHEHLALTSGIYVRTLHVAKTWRGYGFGSQLLNEATKLGRLLGTHVYISTPAANARIRKLLRANRFSENIFWYTPKHTLMVRYIW